MKFHFVSVAILLAVAFIGGCAATQDDRSARYQRSVDELRQAIAEDDQPHLWKGTLAYLEGIPYSELGAPRITSALLSEKAITVHYAGNQLVINGIELLDVKGAVLAYVDFAQDTDAIQAHEAYSVYFGLPIWFPYDDNGVNAETGSRTSHVRLVLPDGSKTELFPLSKATIDLVIGE